MPWPAKCKFLPSTSRSNRLILDSLHGFSLQSKISKDIKQNLLSNCCDSHIICSYSSSNIQAFRVLFFDHGKTQKFGYFSPFGIFLFFSFRALSVMYMFSLLLPFIPAKTFVFPFSKNICLSCQDKQFAFCCRVIRVLHSVEKLTC